MEILIKIEVLIKILASIGTFGAALIAFFTLKEIKKQRIAAQKPQILFNNITRVYVDLVNYPNQFQLNGRVIKTESRTLLLLI